jgi:hypothetical protein
MVSIFWGDGDFILFLGDPTGVEPEVIDFCDDWLLLFERLGSDDDDDDDDDDSADDSADNDTFGRMHLVLSLFY